MSTSTNGSQVPFIDLKAQYRALKDEIDAALGPIFESTAFILGPAVAQFEAAFARYLSVNHCVTVHSGTAALHAALMAVGVGPGDEVVTVPNSFIATAEAISFVGAIPRFVDVDPLTLTMDVKKLEEAITPSTRAILPVHLYGQAADMQPILEIARRHNLKVVEDACQAHGATYKGRRVGSFGEAACFSFYPGKNLGCAGDGGCVATNDQRIADQVRLIRDHGSVKKYEHLTIGHNFRLDTLQAAILNVKLPYLDYWNCSRNRHAAYYSQCLQGVDGIVLPQVAQDRESVFHLYVVQVPDRSRVEEALKLAGIQYGIHYPRPIHLQQAYMWLGHKEGDFPVSEKLSRHAISLPMYPELTEEQQDRVVEALVSAVSEANIHIHPAIEVAAPAATQAP